MIDQAQRSTDTAALLEIMRQFLGELEMVEHRLPENLRRQLPVVANDLHRAISPRPIPRLPLPPDTFRLADGRVLELIDRRDLSAVLGRGAEIGRWAGPKQMIVAASSDLTPHGWLLHVSISYPGHYPSWRDIRAVRGALFPADIDCMMVLPQEADYVAIHPNCFHIWQTPAEWALQ